MAFMPVINHRLWEEGEQMVRLHQCSHDSCFDRLYCSAMGLSSVVSPTAIRFGGCPTFCPRTHWATLVAIHAGQADVEQDQCPSHLVKSTERVYGLG